MSQPAAPVDGSRPGSRWGEALKAVASAAVCLTILLLISTGDSLYGATTLVGPSNAEHPVVLHVESCQRVGPVSRSGFGFWWTCRVTGGRAGAASTVIRRSIVTQADVGHDVTVQEFCDDTGCHHGRLVSRWWSFPMAVLFLGGMGLVFMAGCFTIMLLFRAVFRS
jgi:hypothetical protein